MSIYRRLANNRWWLYTLPVSTTALLGLLPTLTVLVLAQSCSNSVTTNKVQANNSVYLYALAANFVTLIGFWLVLISRQELLRARKQAGFSKLVLSVLILLLVGVCVFSLIGPVTNMLSGDSSGVETDVRRNIAKRYGIRYTAHSPHSMAKHNNLCVYEWQPTWLLAYAGVMSSVISYSFYVAVTALKQLVDHRLPSHSEYRSRGVITVQSMSSDYRPYQTTVVNRMV